MFCLLFLLISFHIGSSIVPLFLFVFPYSVVPNFAEGSSSGGCRLSAGRDLLPVGYLRLSDLQTYSHDYGAYFHTVRSSMVPSTGASLVELFGLGVRDTAAKGDGSVKSFSTFPLPPAAISRQAACWCRAPRRPSHAERRKRVVAPCIYRQPAGR